MKKALIMVAIALVAAVTLTACGSSDVVYSGDYDQNKYAQGTEISGVSFLMPKELYNIKESASNMGKYDVKDLGKHVFTSSDAENFTLYQPGNFFLYVFDLGTGISGISDKHEVSEIPALIGTSKWLTFESRNPNTYTSKNKNGNIQAVYGAYITEKLTGSDVNYSGYVTILKDGKSGKSYCLVVGYGNDKSEATAKDIAENFLLNTK